VKYAPQIQSLLNEGLSINKISKRLGVGKSTIYFHYKKLFGKKTKPVTFNFKDEGELGEFLGIFAGDGNFTLTSKYQYCIRIYTGAYEKGYLKYLENKLPLWFGKKPFKYSVQYKGKTSCIIFLYLSKAIYSLLHEHLFWEGKKGYSVRLRNFNLGRVDFNRGFLRGIVDTDGSYYAPKRRISFTTVSPYLADQAQLIMMGLGLSPKRYFHRYSGKAPVHTLALHGKECKSFLEQVRPNNPNKAPLV